MVDTRLQPSRVMTVATESKPDPESGLQEKGRPGFLRERLQDVDTSFAYLPLLLCCFISGLTDGTIYNGKLTATLVDYRA